MKNEKYADSKLWTNKNFPNKIRADEDIVLIAREDLIFLFVKLISFIFTFIIFWLLKVIIAAYLDNILLDAIDSTFYIVNILLLTTFTLFFHNYYLSLQIVTSERIIDIDQRGLFLREVSELPIDNIEDVSYNQNGFWGTIFNYGDVIVQTAGSTLGQSSDPKAENDRKINGFVFNNVPNPAYISATISQLRQKNKELHMKDNAYLNAQAMKDQLK
ncbi:MAG: PH domain-containing protein [candidate division SR1 bacterium]|nr:PH domain-containing protein [candidate division SR1 bacterium]